MEPVSLPLEQSLLSLHDSIALTAPSLLPLVQKLGHELRNERTKSHRQKVDLLAKLTNTANSHQSSIPTSSSTTTPLKSTKPKQSSNKSPSETASRGRSTMKIHHSFKDRSRSRSAGSVGDTSVSSHASYRTTRSQDSTSKLSYHGTNSTPKIVFFRRANDN